MKLNKKGFTIVELVIVIAVIAILAAVLIPTFSNVIEKANESSALQEAKSAFEEVYALDYADGKLDGKEGPTKDVTKPAKVTTYTTTNGALTKFVYDNGSYTATYENGAWTTAKKTS